MAKLTLETIEGVGVKVSIDRDENLCIGWESTQYNMKFTHEDWLKIQAFLGVEYSCRIAGGRSIIPPQSEDENKE